MFPYQLTAKPLRLLQQRKICLRTFWPTHVWTSTYSKLALAPVRDMVDEKPPTNQFSDHEDQRQDAGCVQLPPGWTSQVSVTFGHGLCLLTQRLRVPQIQHRRHLFTGLWCGIGEFVLLTAGPDRRKTLFTLTSGFKLPVSRSSQRRTFTVDLETWLA